MTCVAGIVAIFVFVELNFGLFERINVLLVDTFPEIRQYVFTLAGASFVGMLVFSVVQRKRVHHEIREKHKLVSTFERDKIIDSVTGLANRNGLLKKLNESDINKLSVLGIEVCNIDTIARIHGSDVAERVEVAIADFLVALSKPYNLLAHCEQSAFHIAFPGLGADESRFRIDRIIDSLDEIAEAGIHSDGLSLRIFVKYAILSVDDLEISTPLEGLGVLQRLEFARRSASGRSRENVVYYDQQMEAAIAQRAFVEANIGTALENGELVPYFQPFVDISNGRVSGFEILARWKHPDGDILPSVFIPILEQSGDLSMMTMSLLAQACLAAREWPDDVKLAINLSPTDLRDEEVIDGFTLILSETGMDPKRIEIEITENAFIEEAEITSQVVAKLKKIGMSISIDDFGTGYSSLHHLRILQFDKLKIDQSFVREMIDNSESRTIVKTMVALGNGFGIPTTAEGIETAEHLEMLQQLGCDLGQGYLFSKPLSQSEVLDFLAGQETVESAPAFAESA